MPKSERDPKTDPRPGDVLLGSGSRRSVIRSGCPSLWQMYRSPGHGNEVLTCTNEEWQKWAANAGIIKQAED
jgi:hypothetical protein